MKKLLSIAAIAAAVLTVGVFASANVTNAGGTAPSNDNFTSAMVIPKIPMSTFFSNANATSEGNDPALVSCGSATGNNYGHTVWYRYTPGFDQTVDISTAGSGFDTVLAVFTGAKGSLTQVACNDDSGNPQSFIKVGLDGGTTYHILAAGYSIDNGGLSFRVTPQDANFFDTPLTLKCYQAKFAKRSARFTRQTISTADQNFEFLADTSVNALALYCNQAQMNIHKSGGGNDDLSADDLKVTCYTARDVQVYNKGGTIAGRRVFAHNTFGDNNLVLGRLESVCTPAIKGSGQIPNLTPFNGEILRCYTARPVKGAPRFEQQSTWLYDQFDEKDARVLRPVSFCTLSGKSGRCTLVQVICAAGDPNSTGPEDFAVVCYALRQASFPAIIIPVIDQFIDQQFVDPELRITKADRVCVSGDKKDAFAPNDDIGNATTVDFQGPIGCGATYDFCPFEDHVVTMKATKARNDPRVVHCESVADSGFDYGHSVWYTFTPLSSLDTDVMIDTSDSTYDTVLVVYTGSKGNLTQVGCNDDDEVLYAETSRLQLDLQVGQKYLIMVGAKERSPGGKLKFHLEDQCDIAGPCD